MKDPLPQKDNPYAGLVAPKRQPLIQDMSDTKTVLNAGWVLEKDNHRGRRSVRDLWTCSSCTREGNWASAFMRRIQLEESIQKKGPPVSSNETQGNLRFIIFSSRFIGNGALHLNQFSSDFLIDFANCLCGYVRTHHFRSFFIFLFAYHVWPRGQATTALNLSSFDTVWAHFYQLNLYCILSVLLCELICSKHLAATYYTCLPLQF